MYWLIFKCYLVVMGTIEAVSRKTALRFTLVAFSPSFDKRNIYIRNSLAVRQELDVQPDNGRSPLNLLPEGLPQEPPSLS